MLGALAPTAFAQGPPSPDPIVLKPYPSPGGDVQATARRLRAEFQRFPDVRIGFDQRTGQILVQAPVGLQAQIAQRIRPQQQLQAPPRQNPLPQQAPAAGGRALPVPEEQAARSASVRLHRATSEQMESALVGIFGSRLALRLTNEPGLRVYQLSLPAGGIQLTLHHPTRQLTVQGPDGAVDACVRLIETLDSPQPPGNQKTRLVSLRDANPQSVRRAVDVIHRRGISGKTGGKRVAQVFQPGSPAVPQPGANDADLQPAREPTEGDLIGPVQIEMLEGLDVLVIRGHRSDVDRVLKIIQQIEQLSTETEPAIEVYALRHVDCRAMADLVRPLYDEIFLPRQGAVSITSLVKPNSLLLIGRRENVQTVIDLVKQLDQPVPPETEFRVFRLRYAAASVVQVTINEFFADRGGLGPSVLVAVDVRSNALIVQARPRDMAEVAKLIARLDTPTSAAVNELRVFQLENSLATDLAPILQQAITGQTAAGNQAAAAARAATQRSAMLRFLTIDAKGRKELKSGILSDVQITADARSNALMVSAPANSMELIAALIRQLDQLPAAEAQIKVFTVVNGDASELATMLEALFGQQATANQPAVRTGVREGESSLVQLRFAVDVRTNSIIASGSMGDLQVVEAILLRLDESDVRHRKSAVYRLKNAPATDVANAINEFLRSERDVQQLNPALMSPFEQIEREVVVVPEPVSNSLIVSATPRFFEEVAKLVEQLDERPPMVMIQVLIAEVSLNDTDEFGVELGLQDSILFDRSLLSEIQTISQTISDPGQPQVTNQQIVSAEQVPGFLFNSATLGDNAADRATGTLNGRSPGTVGSQGIANFSVGRMNDELGFGGLVLSASSESVSILIRALKSSHRIEVLSRPQIMTLDNQPAFIQVGQRVPRITGMQTNETGQTNSITMENVGLILGVTPRISPDGLVVMEIDAEKSEVGPIEDGIPVAFTEGQEIKSPKIDTTTAQTTVSALSGQTVVLGGLITKSKSEFHRQVPGLGDLPLIGRLFRYDGVNIKRRELVVIMTPHIIRSEAEAEALKQTEVSRLSWCLADVIELQGEGGLRGRSDDWSDAETRVIYPDLDPSGETLIAPQGPVKKPEIVPAPPSPPGEHGIVPPLEDSSQRFPGLQAAPAVYHANRARLNPSQTDPRHGVPARNAHFVSPRFAGPAQPPVEPAGLPTRPAFAPVVPIAHQRLQPAAPLYR